MKRACDVNKLNGMTRVTIVCFKKVNFAATLWRIFVINKKSMAHRFCVIFKELVA